MTGEGRRVADPAPMASTLASDAVGDTMNRRLTLALAVLALLVLVFGVIALFYLDRPMHLGTRCAPGATLATSPFVQCAPSPAQTPP